MLLIVQVASGGCGDLSLQKLTSHGEENVLCSMLPVEGLVFLYCSSLELKYHKFPGVVKSAGFFGSLVDHSCCCIGKFHRVLST